MNMWAILKIFVSITSNLQKPFSLLVLFSISATIISREPWPATTRCFALY